MRVDIVRRRATTVKSGVSTEPAHRRGAQIQTSASDSMGGPAQCSVIKHHCQSLRGGVVDGGLDRGHQSGRQRWRSEGSGRTERIQTHSIGTIGEFGDARPECNPRGRVLSSARARCGDHGEMNISGGVDCSERKRTTIPDH